MTTRLNAAVTGLALGLIYLILTGCAQLDKFKSRTAEEAGKAAKIHCERGVPFMTEQLRQDWLAEANEAAAPHKIRSFDCANVTYDDDPGWGN